MYIFQFSYFGFFYDSFLNDLSTFIKDLWRTMYFYYENHKNTRPEFVIIVLSSFSITLKNNNATT